MYEFSCDSHLAALINNVVRFSVYVYRFTFLSQLLSCDKLFAGECEVVVLWH